MPIEGITCDKCGSSDVIEYKPNSFLCKACDHTFKYVDPTHAEVEVAPQFCEEGCGNPIKYKCALCGKMVCEKHGAEAWVHLGECVELPWFGKEQFKNVTNPELQNIWCVECFIAIDSDALIELFMLCLDEDDDGVRLAAVQGIGKTRNASAISPLSIALSDPSPLVRSWAVNAFRDIGHPSSTMSEWSRALSDEDLRVRGAAVALLIQTNSAEALPYLLCDLTNEDSEVRLFAARSLGDIGDNIATPYLMDSLNDSSGEVREAVASALGGINDPSALPALAKAFCANGNHRVENALVKAGPDAIPYLVRALEISGHSKRHVRETAARALDE